MPLIINQQNVVMCGNGRLVAALQLGLAELPCIRVTDLNEAQLSMLAIADNKIGDESSFDDAQLQAVLKDLVGLDFDIELTGFDMGEIDFRIDGPARPVRADPADAVPAVNEAVAPTTRAGDLWLLGKHRLYCGSALKNASFERALNGELARMVFVDVPYNVPIPGHASGNGRITHRPFLQASGELSEAQFRDEFLRPAHSLLAAHSVDGSIHFICIDWRSLPTLMAACKGIYSEIKNICVWVKTPGMGSLYRSQHEFVLVAKKGKAPHVNNVELGKNGRNRSNVWDYPRVAGFGATRQADLAMHPTVKPTALVADAIRDCSKRNDLIVDAFVGSGTTIIAGERTGRRVAAIELDPIYVDVAVRRWEALTGKAATLEGDGRSFAEISAERGAEPPSLTGEKAA